MRWAGAAGFASGVLNGAVRGPLGAEAWGSPSRHGPSGVARVGPEGDGQRAPAAWEREGRREAGGGAERVGQSLGCRGGCVCGDGRLATIALLPTRDLHAI